ncbi:KdsC family phosphatase [Sphingobacterium paludis]|jgi:3-deoxy-D-manno-octulosonate 8-phosphate phosphatase (KDO 8-P phosphatase)|uniref:3-deoxy-D-manno-octulosonate 8-phosphate phosphatase (KDO 8-P phosphatase) n=1 Tax=Sphingobacterium paludis TaxID=1476465 RepID=A0A4R7D486_9SPHI|nr:HAD-IIIA family hydrolase [Sphingobacterium paludis]TDS15883.1 3-deoxy-D-manno-octulosonate 8-phosphate phosphatase (KDO 8-P phosphatase) [Sphingobacterium paludis]
MVLQQFAKIKAVVLDVDGVLTDGTVLVTEAGEQLRRFSIKDGYAIQLAMKAGLHIIVISGGQSQGVLQRMSGLGVKEVHLGVSDKLTLMRQIISRLGLAIQDIAFMGDDIPDLLCMKDVALALCPQDAVDEIKNIAAYVSPYRGGEGCVRDVLEKILRLRGLWNVETGIKSI